MKFIRSLAALLTLVLMAPLALAQDIGANIPVTSTWSDITVAYPSLAGTSVYVQDRGTPVFVLFSSSGTAPTGGGVLLNNGDIWVGNAAHIWVETASAGGPNGTISAGLQIASGGPVTAASGAYASGAIADLGTGASPAANTTNAWLKSINTALGSPLQAAGSVSVTALPALSAGTNLVGKVDTIIQSTAVNRGAIIGFTGAQITTTSSSTTITLTTVPTSGALAIGEQIIAAGIPAGDTIATLASGTLNAASSTYTLAAAATASGTAVATTSAGPVQIMASNTARRGNAYQVQSSTANCWVSGIGAATTDYNSLKIPAATYFESAPTHSGTGAVSVMCDTAATPFYAREW